MFLLFSDFISRQTWLYKLLTCFLFFELNRRLKKFERLFSANVRLEVTRAFFENLGKKDLVCLEKLFEREDNSPQISICTSAYFRNLTSPCGILHSFSSLLQSTYYTESTFGSNVEHPDQNPLQNSELLLWLKRVLAVQLNKVDQWGNRLWISSICDFVTFRKNRGQKIVDSFEVGAQLTALLRDRSHLIVDCCDGFEIHSFICVPIPNIVLLGRFGHK